MKFGLSHEQWNLIHENLILPLKQKGARLWVFGSRATGTFQKFSDIDFLYEPSHAIADSFIYEIKSNIEESNLPIKVDLVSINDLAETYKSQVLKDRVEI